MSAASSPSTPPQITHDIEVAPFDELLDVSVVSFEAAVGDHTLRLEIEQGAGGGVAYLALGPCSGDYLRLSGDVWPKLKTIVALIATAERDNSRLAARAQALVAAARGARQRLHPGRGGRIS